MSDQHGKWPTLASSEGAEHLCKHGNWQNQEGQERPHEREPPLALRVWWLHPRSLLPSARGWRSALQHGGWGGEDVSATTLKRLDLPTAARRSLALLYGEQDPHCHAAAAHVTRATPRHATPRCVAVGAARSLARSLCCCYRNETDLSFAIQYLIDLFYSLLL